MNLEDAFCVHIAGATKSTICIRKSILDQITHSYPIGITIGYQSLSTDWGLSKPPTEIKNVFKVHGLNTDLYKFVKVDTILSKEDSQSIRRLLHHLIVGNEEKVVHYEMY